MKKEQSKYPDYDLVDTSQATTFGTCVYLRKDKRAIKIVFPAGTSMTFAPMDEIEELKQVAII